MFLERLDTAISESVYRGNRRQVSVDAGLGEKFVSNLLGKEEMNTSKLGPGLFAMARIAEVLGVSLEYLATGRKSLTTGGPKEFNLASHLSRIGSAASGQLIDQSSAPTPQAMLRLYANSGGMIEAFSDVIKYCDQYDPINEGDTYLKVRAVGDLSLAAVTMGQADHVALQEALDQSPPVMFEAVRNHRAANEFGAISIPKYLNVQMPNMPKRVRMDYILTLLSLRSKDGEQTTLSYSALIA